MICDSCGFDGPFTAHHLHHGDRRYTICDVCWRDVNVGGDVEGEQVFYVGARGGEVVLATVPDEMVTRLTLTERV